MTASGDSFALLMGIATANERLIEWVLGRVHRPGINRHLPLVAALLGIGEVFALRLNVLPPEVPAVVGMAVTGIAVGLGSQGIHWLRTLVTKQT